MISGWGAGGGDQPGNRGTRSGNQVREPGAEGVVQMGLLDWGEDRRCSGEGPEGSGQGLGEGRAVLRAEVQCFFIVPVFLPLSPRLSAAGHHGTCSFFPRERQ